MKSSKLKNIVLASSLLLFSVNSAFALQYKDVPIGYWAYGQIDELSNEELISGFSDNTFRPGSKITRAEYCALIIKAIGQENIPIETMYSFEDLPNTNWAWGYVERAINLDIIKPASESYFYPKDPVTRREMITFLVNILKSEDITKKEAIQALQNAYLDFDDIPDWFKVTAGKAEVLGVIAKEPPREKYLDYDGYITRAQMAVFLYNLKEKIDSYKKEKAKEETSPQKGEGIVIDNTLRNEDVVTLPIQTVLPMMIMGQLSSDKTSPGQMFQARFANNIVDNEHNILLSKDIVLIGKVLDTTRSKNFVRNGGIMLELSAANKNNNFTKILGMAEYQAKGKAIIKGKEYVAKDGQILYIKLYKPLRVNIVTGEVLD
jgi:hypothetical protein